MIAILDYGAGNLRAVENTLAEIGETYILVRDAAGLRSASKIILPDAGHFGEMMRALEEMQVRAALIKSIRAGGMAVYTGRLSLMELAALIS